MMDFTSANARKLARLLITIEKEKREKIIWCLDTEFRTRVLAEVNILKLDMPLEMQDTLPPGRIPNCS